jgi:hypothetical protein
MRITDQYFWNIVFLGFFSVLVILMAIILETEAIRDVATLTLTDFALMTLATWRVIRLFVYDAITKFFREQFWDVEKTKTGLMLVKPERGPRRTIADLLSCPWCFGVWAGAIVVFAYLTFAWAWYVVAFLAISAAATFLQLLSNLVGHRAEALKRENDRGF